MNDLAVSIAFYALALVTVLSAVGVDFKKNILHSALLLAVCFIGVGGIYVLLHADFLAAVQILVYSGAVAVIITLAVMLTKRDVMEETNPSNNNFKSSIAVVASFILLTLLAILATPWKIADNVINNSVELLADLMLTKFIIPFEVAAILLLAAMIGAIILAKGVNEE